jgi:hypothetical protein
MDFQKDLAAMQKNYDESKKTYDPNAMGNFSHVPDGKYLAKECIDLQKTKDGKKLMAIATFSIADGEYQGSDEKMFFILTRNPKDEKDPDRGLHNLQRWFGQHSLECPEKLMELPEIFEKITLQNPTVEIAVATKKGKNKEGEEQEYTNVYLNRVIDEVSLDSTSSEEPEVEEQTPPDSDSDEYTTMDRKELKKLISNDDDLSTAIRVIPKMTVEEIREKIREIKNGVVSEEESEDNSELLTFCASQGIEEVTENSSRDDIIEAMKGYEFNASELTGEEVTMLTSLGLESQIKKPAPVKKAAARISGGKK